MFNSLMEQGVELQLYQYPCGTALRSVYIIIIYSYVVQV